MRCESTAVSLVIPLVLALTQCHPSPDSDSATLGDGAAAPVSTSATTLTTKQTARIEADVSGDLTAHIDISGTNQIGRLEPSFIRFTFSESNDAPVDASTRLTFSLQSGDDPVVGTTIHGQGHLVYNGEAFHTTLCEIVVVSQTPPTGATHQRQLEGTFVCHDMHGPDRKRIEATNGHFVGPFEDLRVK
jgi:hypothetical protein